jgi:hypothetical protein
VKRVGAAGRGEAGRGEAHAWRFTGVQLETFETREPGSPAVERGYGVDAAAPPTVSDVQVVRQHSGIGLDDLQQVVLVRDARQAVFLLRRGEPGHVVLIAVLDAENVLAHLPGQRRLREIGRRVRAAFTLADDEPVDAERFAIEEHGRVQAER